MLLDQILSHVPSAVFWKDGGGNVLGCNETFLGFLGLKQPDVFGKNDKDLPWANRWKEYRADDEYVMRTGKILTRIENIRLPDNREILAKTTKTPLLDHDKVIGVLGIFHDITDLMDAKEKAESANRAKTEFLSAMVNELREVLDKEKIPPKQLLNRLVNDIEHFANYDLNKDNSLLEFVESSSGKRTAVKNQKQTDSDDFLKARKTLGLSKRESECAYYLTRGMTMKLVAKAMGLSPRTVEFYIENMKDKLRCNTKPDLIARLLDAQG